MYVLHIANKLYSSWSLRPWLLMRESGIPFTEHQVPFAAQNNREAFRAFSPAGTVPCLQDGGRVVWDSLAITEYLAERHPGLWPADADARAWARCAAAEMHSGFGALRGFCPMHCGLRIRTGTLSPALAQDIGRVDELWQEGLSRFGGPFLAGAAFTAVDAFFAPVAFRVQTYGLPLSPAAAEYGARLLALPGMRDWEKAALAEPWSEPGHEAEARAVGTLVADLRKAG
jgi:glutathione S-transferase